jgi:Tfp pilus assembly protein PilF
MAVSKLRGETTTRAQREAALGLLDRAVAATPRDPAVLALRALVRLGHADALGALADLEAALAVDPQNGRARLLLSAFRRAGEQGTLPWLAGEEFRTRLEQALQRLSARGAVLPDQRRFVDDMRLIFAPLR